MHPFKLWLSNVQFPVPYELGPNSNDWVDFETGESFKEFLLQQKTTINKINRMNTTANAPVKLLELYVEQFGGKPLKRQSPHYDHHVMVAERKRHDVIKACDDFLAINICHHDYLNQVQFWLVRHKASLNEILMNIASIAMITSIFNRLEQRTLNEGDLWAINGGAIEWRDEAGIVKIKNKVLLLLSQLVHFEKIAFKNFTQDEIQNPEKYLKKIANLRILEQE